MYHISVLHNIFFPFNARFSFFLRSDFSAERNIILISDYFLRMWLFK